MNGLRETQRVRSERGSGTSGLGRLPSRIVIGVILAVLALTMLYPLYLMITASFKPLDDYQANPLGWPEHWTLDNYAEAWEKGSVKQYVLNSVLVTGLCLALTVVVVTPAAFAFAKLRFPGRQLILGALLALVVVPGVMQMVPVFKIANTFGLIDTYAGLALVLVAFHISFGVYLLSGYLEGVPAAVFEAAEIDGCGIFGSFFRIALPIAMPGLLTLLTFSFLSYWNEFLLTLIILLDPNKRTLPVGIRSLQASQGYESVPLEAAGIVITMLPCALVFLLLQRKLSEGLVAGVSK